MGPHVVNVLQQNLCIVLDFPENKVGNRKWMRALINEAKAALIKLERAEWPIAIHSDPRVFMI